MTDIEDINSIKVIVDAFYIRVREDEVLAPIFMNAIPGDWGPHLNKMYGFWNAAMFGVQGYKGNPFARHVPLPISREHFERWLMLFGQTVNQYFNGPVAEDIKKRAGLMSEMFQAKLAVVDRTKVIF
ncbi:group III truncated hemoglobin [Mucilaginibacter terrigena]|uniref:Group III truncated hemoglobin n=1 Tax=Mucilaginibacter terrigena TaxID=2492395 RepID=A0A4Q5LRR6_9SPHI|nr:group III truncated hemoglobin [Mucilaginibacter terrigena]RYU92175.1 group III truncated hemoglobin [Mucilaginibacter terrigena]